MGNEHFQAIIAAYRILLIDILAHSSRNTGLVITGTTPASTSVTASWLRSINVTCSRVWRPPKKNPGGAHPTGEYFRFRAHGLLLTNKNSINFSVSRSYEQLTHLYFHARGAHPSGQCPTLPSQNCAEACDKLLDTETVLFASSLTGFCWFCGHWYLVLGPMLRSVFGACACALKANNVDIC